MPNLHRIQSPGIINQDLNEESSKSKALSPIHNCESSIKNITIEPMAGLDSTSHIPKTSMASSMINNHGGTDIQDQLTNEKVVDTAKVEGHGPDKVYKDKSSMINGPENVPDSKGNAIALIANDYKVSHARSAHHNTESGLVNGVMGEADAGETGDKVTSSARASTAAAIQETTEVPHLAGSLPPRRHRSKLQALLPPQYGLRESKVVLPPCTCLTSGQILIVSSNQQQPPTLPYRETINKIIIDPHVHLSLLMRTAYLVTI